MRGEGGGEAAIVIESADATFEERLGAGGRVGTEITAVGRGIGIEGGVPSDGMPGRGGIATMPRGGGGGRRPDSGGRRIRPPAHFRDPL